MKRACSFNTIKDENSYASYIRQLFINLLRMKKIVFIVVVAFALALGVQSCKSTADCPAYGQVKTEQPQVKA